MNVCIIQPFYSTDYSRSEELFLWEMAQLEQCDPSMDIIVMPEAADVPCLAPDAEAFFQSHARFTEPLLKKAAETAKRCGAVLFINGCFDGEHGVRNTTNAFNSKGEPAGHYYKQHLTPGEVTKRRLDSRYTFEYDEPTVLEIEGLRYGFLTCYDFYFYESYAHMARKNLDIIIGCSHQRSDTHLALELMSQFLAYNTNAYVLRSSVSMDENSTVGGCSLVAAPNGELLLNMKSRVGMETVEIDPHAKYYKPAGFGNPPAAHYEYVEQGRRPWKYRPAGSAICLPDFQMPYPRVCAHRGFNSIAPENSMPAFGAAVAMGAEEIEFDLWWTKDGEVVSIHDPTLDRVSDGTGKVYEHTYEELLQYDFGSKKSEEFKGLKILRFEEILQKFACHVIMNIHIKSIDNVNPLSEEYLRKIIALIDKYDCRKHVYFMTGNDTLMAQLRELAPDICRCMGAGDRKMEIVERAIELGCKKVQLFTRHYTPEMIQKAHDHGIICNYFYVDTPEDAENMLAQGIDCLLTNDYNRISQVTKRANWDEWRFDS
ncbi:MAG: hypothetical protein IJP27_07325 [Clostridia bacterium]|nr:hypothetical protein [Clostridia bacterium]